VDPLTLGARDYILDIRYENGVKGLPKKMKVTLEPSGCVGVCVCVCVCRGEREIEGVCVYAYVSGGL
jgi:hypothetical protein